jgi:hypothetical protein
MMPISSLWLGVSVLLVSSPALYIILYFIRPVDYVQFKDKTGKILFDIVHTKEKSVELDDFVATLQYAATSEEPNQTAQRNASTGSASNFESPARRG